MKNFKKFVSFLILSAVSFACTEEYVVVSTVLPQYIKKIAVVQFKDIDGKTNEFTDKLELTIKDKFVVDRRITLVNLEEADAFLTGNVSRYLLSPIEFSSAKVPTKYLLWVWVDISLYDNVSKDLLWTEQRLEAKVNYSIKSENMFEPTTEPEAQDIAINKLAEDIVKRTIDGWFNASGVSERR